MGLFSAAEPEKYEIDDKQLICMFCRNDTFFMSTEALHAPTRTFVDLQLTYTTATCFACSSCGYMHWFMR